MSFPISYDASLNKEQKNIICKPYSEGALHRGYSYIKENPEVILVAMIPFKTPYKDLDENCQVLQRVTVASGLLGAVRNKLLCKSVLAGYSIGFFAGFAIFESVVILDNISRIKNSWDYFFWKEQRVKLFESQSVIEFIEKDDILSHLLCPISKKIPLIPAKSVDDVTYDYDAAIEWMELNPHKCLPGSSYKTDITDLKFDYAHINAVIQRLHALSSVLKKEERIRVCLLLGARDIPTNINLQKLLNVADIICANKYATIIQLFSGKNEVNKKSLHHISRIFFEISTSSFKQRSARKDYFNQEYTELMSRPHVECSQKRELNAALSEFFEKTSLVKQIVILQQSIYDKALTCFFGCKPKIDIRRVIDLNLSSRVWGFDCVVGMVETLDEGLGSSQSTFNIKEI